MSNLHRHVFTCVFMLMLGLNNKVEECFAGLEPPEGARNGKTREKTFDLVNPILKNELDMCVFNLRHDCTVIKYS